MHSSKMNYSGEPNKYIIIDKNASVKGSHHDSFRKYLSAVAEMLSKLPFYLTFTSKQLSGSVLRIVSIFFSTFFAGAASFRRHSPMQAARHFRRKTAYFRESPDCGSPFPRFSFRWPPREPFLLSASSYRLFLHSSSQFGHICLPSGITQPQIAQTSTGGEM